MENGNIQVHAQSKKRSKTKWIIIEIYFIEKGESMNENL